MFKYLLVVLAFCYQTQGSASTQDTIQTLPLAQKLSGQRCNEIIEGMGKKPTTSMPGQNNYHVGQQIFYINHRYKEMDNKFQQYPDGYIVTSGIGVHKLHTIKLSWNKARNTCIREGGHLAVINSDVEEKILLSMMRDQKVDNALLGIHDQFEEGDWVTINDVALENTGYSRWTIKWGTNAIPDNLNGNQNCGSLMQPEGGMDDVDCASLKPFFCEIPESTFELC